MAARYAMTATGLWRKAGDDGSDIWVAAPFEVLAETRDDRGEDRGLWLAWHDREGGRHEVALPATSLTSDGHEARSRLAYGGLRQNPHPKARQAMLEFLAACLPGRFALCVPSVGWHQVAGSWVFVLPSRIIGTAKELVVFQPGERGADAFNASGTLAEWREDVAALCVGNTRLIFAVCITLAAPLLALAEEGGGGINLRGRARSGKSTALRVAASVWGGTPDKGAAGFMHAWRSTDNALEAVAAMHSDAGLVLDEIGQADEKTVGASAYMLANGRGRVRARRDGMARPVVTFRTLFLSSGERGLADLIAEAGKTMQAGQEVRLIDVPSDAGAGLGLFENLHDAADGDVFVRRLSEATQRCYGTAAPAFVEHLVAELARDAAGLQESIRARIGGFIKAWLTVYPDAGGQVRSVARRFALAAVAGELATEAGITGWDRGLAADAARVCFEQWLADRGTVGAREDQQAQIQLRSFISRFGSSRFEDWIDPRSDAATDASPTDEEGGTPKGTPPVERFRPAERAGWKRWVPGPMGKGFYRFFVTSDGMQAALAGLEFKAAVRTLVTAGMILPSAAQSDMRKNIIARVCKPPSAGNGVRLYCLADDVLAGGAEE